MSHFAVLAIGRDRSGIVAAITRELTDLNYGIETSQMALLGDQFSMMLVVAGPDLDRDELRNKLSASRPDPSDENPATSYEIVVTEIEEYDSRARTEASHLVTVLCEERVGVISAISQELSVRDVNITHLHSRVQPYEDKLFCMVRAYATLPRSISARELEKSLSERLDQLGDRGRSDGRMAAVKIEELIGDRQGPA